MNNVMSLPEIINFFNVSYPCDKWLETHVSDIRTIRNDECKCFIQEDHSYDILFTIVKVTVKDRVAIIELGDYYDNIDNDPYEMLSGYGNCISYKMIWKDEKGKDHSYEVCGRNEYGHNLGLYLKEVE